MKDYKKITFDDLLNVSSKIYVFYMIKKILQYNDKYEIWINDWERTGISKELFGYSANNYNYKYDLLDASKFDLELLMYKFIYKNSPTLNELRNKEFKKEFKKRQFYLKINNDKLDENLVNKIKDLNGEEIINKRNDEEIYYFHNIMLYTLGQNFILEYSIYYEIKNTFYDGYYDGKYLVQNDDENLFEFLQRGYKWLSQKLVK